MYHPSPRLSLHYLVVLNIAVTVEHENPISEADILLILENFLDSGYIEKLHDI